MPGERCTPGGLFGLSMIYGLSICGRFRLQITRLNHNMKANNIYSKCKLKCYLYVLICSDAPYFEVDMREIEIARAFKIGCQPPILY